MEITQGKWEFNTKGGWCEVQVKEPLKSICAININIEEHIANGKLMALAPELLFALQDLVRFCKENNVGAELELAEKVLEKTLT